jgi:DNA polymerase alpha-associated DNA helicase A
MAPKAVDPQAFAATQLGLLDQELQCEVAETSSLISGASPKVLQRAGVAIANLNIVSQRTGLGGKTVLELGADGAFTSAGKDGEGELPEHGIRSGDLVEIRDMNGGAKGGKRKGKSDVGGKEESGGVKGVVTRVGKMSVWVAVDEGKGEDAVDGLGERLWIVKLADEVTHKRFVSTLSNCRDFFL